jgi:hypothetical protein
VKRRRGSLQSRDEKPIAAATKPFNVGEQLRIRRAANRLATEMEGFTMQYATKSTSRHMVAKIGTIIIFTAMIVVTSGGVSKAANPGTYKATCAGSYTGDPNLSYDGEVNLAVGNLSGHDNIEGNFLAQDYAEDALTSSGTCCPYSKPHPRDAAREL